MQKYKKVLNDKFTISAPTQRKEFELCDRSYSVPDIHDYFDYIIKKHATVTDSSFVRINVNKIENRITFKRKQDIISNF